MKFNINNKQMTNFIFMQNIVKYDVKYYKARDFFLFFDATIW